MASGKSPEPGRQRCENKGMSCVAAATDSLEGGDRWLRTLWEVTGAASHGGGQEETAVERVLGQRVQVIRNRSPLSVRLETK